ncbi:MAG: hypothetical protein V4642_14870 [Bacteroidota bacterium]
MNAFKRTYRLLVAALLFVMAVGTADACPNCKEAFSTKASTGKTDMGGATKDKTTPKVKQGSVGNSYSVSILLMLGMPITVLGGIGMIIYNQAQRGKKLQAEQENDIH